MCHQNDNLSRTKKLGKISLEEKFSKYKGRNLAKDFSWED